MEQDISVNDFIAKSVNGIIVDVRTPAEFAQGHIPGAVNIPLFTDEERVIIGTLYKKQGKDVAVEKGLEFVGPKMARFVKEAKALAKSAPVYIYCWRGGMRSGSMAWLFRTAGLQVYRLTGGYKAYRSSFLEEVLPQIWKIIVLGGPTGSGKTAILEQLTLEGEQVLDLESLANHKGSAFGALGQPDQPSTEHFTNLIHEKFRTFDPEKPVWCEGESHSVGRVYIPKELYDQMQISPFIYLSIPKVVRLKRIVEEYGRFDAESLIESFRKIERRMGGQHVKAAIEFIRDNKIEEAASLGLDYYDKSYNNAIEKNRSITYTHSVETDCPNQTAKELKQLAKEIYQ
ncbi:MAG: tRNA 2-selenouridine(34) synthase MnmH [Bacteroidales bacterium]